MPAAASVARPVRVALASTAATAIPERTDSEKTTMSPNRLGARMKVKPGIVEYSAEYRPPRGPNDNHAAARPTAP